MIRLDKVTKTYGVKTAVHELSLEVGAGELFAFLGPNGAGKTTTIKMIVGLLFPTSGAVQVGGYDMRREGDRARQLLSYVPDLPFLYEKLTGREFLQFIADMYGLPPDHARGRIARVIELFGLEDFVDDPTVGLDPRSVRLLKDLLRREADRGVTVFLSSHSLEIVEQLASRIGII